jgi:ribosome-binding factor A
MDEVRNKRIAHKIQAEIGEMIVQGILKDPRVTSSLTVTEVEVSGDTSVAKVYISSFEGEEAHRSGVDALNHAAGFIQGRVGKILHTRNTPRLTFYMDRSIERGTEMIRKLEELDS